MASEEEEKLHSDGKGFAGLSSMVSDVDATVASTSIQQHRESPSPSTQQSSPAAQPARQERPRPSQQTHQAPVQPSAGSSAGKWLLGIAALIGVIWLVNQSNNNSSSRSTYSPAPLTSEAPALTGQQPEGQPQAPSRPAEDQPSIGRNNVLSTAQIRYCLAEKIRIDAAESMINNYVDTDVDRFNAYVNDYNGRCGEFRYRRGALESAQRDVEPYRSQLQAEGRSRFVSSPSAATRSQTPTQTAQPIRPSPDANVQAIQQRLNELGYDAGPADGSLGGRTVAAIKSFQRSIGMAPDGVVSSSLLSRLNASLRDAGVSQNALGTRGVPEPPNVETAPQAVRWAEPSRDRYNFNTCISGEYPSLCKHSLLTREEAVQVEAAEKRANFRMCISGQYPSLCKHSWLTREEAAQVSSAEKRANYLMCITGQYPALCKHSLLTSDEAVQVQVAERRANFSTCISGYFPPLCKHSLLTQDEAARVADAERRARRR